MKETKKVPKNQVFLDMCTWIEKEIFNYDTEHQKLQTKAVMRLQGLRRGQGYANTKVRANGDYSYEVIWITFKVHKQLILNSLKGKTFRDEEAKMAYVCAIVRGKINDVYTKLQNKTKAEEKAENVNVASLENKGANYVKQSKESNKKFEELW